jgi:hypothetical protein
MIARSYRFGLEFETVRRNFWRMMRFCWRFAVIVWLLVLGTATFAATGKVIKVLPEFLDKEGRTSLSPSLYERDAYQANLRNHPEKRSGLKFFVQWKTKGPLWEPIKLRLELRGRSEGNLPKQLVLEEALVNKGTAFTRWTGITLNNAQYKELGSVTAWRVTLWEGNQLLGQQQSFLW